MWILSGSFDQKYFRLIPWINIVLQQDVSIWEILLGRNQILQSIYLKSTIFIKLSFIYYSVELRLSTARSLSSRRRFYRMCFCCFIMYLFTMRTQLQLGLLLQLQHHTSLLTNPQSNTPRYRTQYVLRVRRACRLCYDVRVCAGCGYNLRIICDEK